MQNNPEIVVVGAAHLDVPIGPVDESIFGRETYAVERIPLGFGGDALNESTVLAKLGRRVRLISRIGDDMAGRMLLTRCDELGVDRRHFTVQPGLDTGVNLVLILPGGERTFVTASAGSLRTLRPEDVRPQMLTGARLLCFASIFVSNHFDAASLAALMRTGREQGLITCADMTRCKHGETTEDLRDALRQIDYLFANEEEAGLFTREQDPERMLGRLLDAGVGHVVLKLGARGCVVATGDRRVRVPACPVAHVVDTTGAGDSFAAGFLHTLLGGGDLETCARFANATASLTVEALGAAAGIENAAQVERRVRLSY